jgi:hypothetical protein
MATAMTTAMTTGTIMVTTTAMIITGITAIRTRRPIA